MMSATAAAGIALFDLDDTLFDRAATYRRWAYRFVERHGYSSEEVQWLCDADEDGLSDRHDLWAAAKERYGLTESVEELIAAYRGGFLESIDRDDGVLSALAQLRTAGWSIGVVTNGEMPYQADKAERLGLLSFVDAICVSGALGVSKPDRRIFETAIRRCHARSGYPPSSRVWMVGDSPRADVAGSRSVGARTIWVCRGRIWDPADGLAPDHVVGVVIEAVHHLLQLEQ